MMRKIDKWSDRILSPIANNLVFFVISFILLFAPAVIRDYSDVRYWIMAIPISIALAYIVSLPRNLERNCFNFSLNF